MSVYTCMLGLNLGCGMLGKFCHRCFTAQNEFFGVDDLEGLNFGVPNLFSPFCVS